MIDPATLTNRRGPRPRPLDRVPVLVLRALQYRGQLYERDDRILIAFADAVRLADRGVVELLGHGLDGFRQTVAL